MWFVEIEWEIEDKTIGRYKNSLVTYENNKVIIKFEELGEECKNEKNK